jgi:peptidoglycan/xylan/chitin deacetylase (PgdA/CDA1 family)
MINNLTMKTKSKNFRIFTSATIGIILIIVLGCEKEDPPGPPTLNTLPVTDITATSARSGGNITDDGGDHVTARGVLWSTSENPSMGDNEGMTSDGEGTGEYFSNLNNLSPGVKYYVRAYATNATGTVYGTRVEFTSLSEIASVATSEVTDITSSSATSGGNVADDGGSPVTARGIVWSTSENPAVDNNEGITADGEGTGEFTSSLNELSPGARYYVRAYATNAEGTGYGSQVEFTTLGEFASVTTSGVTDITSSSATSGGSVTDDGGSPVTARGIVWGTSENPAVESNEGLTVDGEGTGEFTSSLTGLSPGARYYVRAYATNDHGTAYGSQAEFTALKGTASVTTAEVTDITSSSAVSGGNVTDDGGSPVTARGVAWSVSSNPEVDGNNGLTVDGEGTGEFASSLSELSPGTKYYVRAYATSDQGTVYGSQVEFTTSGELAGITTAEVANITSTSATAGGSVDDDGGSPVTARGIVWSKEQNPSVVNHEGRTTDGEGPGEFTSELSGLTPGTNYYLKAYATNSTGTSYGNQVSFETLDEEAGIPGPLFVFGFDDGFDSDYYYAWPLLKSRGVRGVSFANTSVIGTEGALTWDMIHEMVADGWEMGCHTHSHLRLDEASEQEIRDEMETVNSLYREQKLPVPKHLTYPNGAVNQLASRIVSEYRLTGRRYRPSSSNYSNTNFNYMEYAWLHADMRNEEGPNGLNNAKAEVDMAFENQTVLVSFLIHRVVEDLSAGYQCKLIYLQQLVDYIIERGGNIVTQDEAYEIIREYRQNANLE